MAIHLAQRRWYNAAMTPRICRLCVVFAACLVWLAPSCRKTPPAPPERPGDKGKKTRAAPGPEDKPVAVYGPAATTRSTTASRPAASRPSGATRPASATKPTATPRSIRTATDALAKQPFDRAGWNQARSKLPATQPAGLGAHILAGDRALARGEFDAAVESFYQAFDLASHHQDTLQGLAVALTAAQRFREAVAIYEMILGLNPNDQVARFNLAVALSRLRRLGEAERTYEKLLAFLADNPSPDQEWRAWYNLATLLQAQGKLSRAKAAWREVTERVPQLASAHTFLGEVLMDLGNFKGAVSAFSASSKLEPKVVSGWLNLGTSARLAGMYGTAVMATRQARTLAPEDAEIWARLGQLEMEIHRSFGKKVHLVRAVEAWQKSLSLDGDQPMLRELIETYRRAAAAGDETPATNPKPPPGVSERQER